MRKILVILLFMYCSAIADEWITIIPLPHCEEFQVQYRFDGKFHIRYKETPESQYKVFDKKLDDINDLSILTDELVELSYNYCPMTFSLTEIDGEILCIPDTENSKPFSSEYTAMIQGMINLVDYQGKNCDDVIPLIELQNQITSLNQEQLMSFDKANHILKIFTGDFTDNLIDHYYECGGKDGSTKFVENLILLEAKNACIMPSPPGLLSIEQAKKIAKEVAKDYPKLGLISLNSKQTEITSKTIKKFVDTALKTQVKTLMGKEFNADQFVEGLDIYKRMNNTKPGKMMEFSNYIIGVDAPLEIVDKGLPKIIEKNFSGMLPENMSYSEKAKFLRDEITPKIKDDYESCIEEYKETVKFPSSFKQKDLVKYRKKLEGDYCEANPNECNKVGCNQTKNFGTLRSDITDMNIIQSCLFKGITHAVEPVLETIILAQQEEFADKIGLSKQSAKDISELSYRKIYKCADEKVKAKSNSTYTEGFTENTEALLHLSTEEYTEILVGCAKQIERDLTGSFAELMIAQMDVVESNFGDQFKVTRNGMKLNHGANKFAKKITKEALDSCLQAQRDKIKDTSVSAISCQPIIELYAGKAIVESTLKRTLEEANVNSKESAKILRGFDYCASGAIKNANYSFYNPNADSPIFSPDQAKTFLENDHQFLGCIKETIGKVSTEVSSQVLDDMQDDLKDQLKDPDFLKGLKRKIVKKVNMCFSQGLDKISSWPNFIKFNENNGTEKLKQKCTEEATAYALPKIISNETRLQLIAINDTGLTNTSLRDITLGLQKEYGLKTPPDQFNFDEVLIEQAYKKFIKKNPKATVQDFVDKYAKTTQLNVFEDIGDNIVGKIIETSKPGYDFSELGEVLTPQCFNDIYTNQKDNLKALIEKIESQPKDPNKPKTDLKPYLVQIIKDGLIRAKIKGRYEKFIDTIEDLCENPDKTKDVKVFAKTGLLDDIIAGIGHEKIKKSLKKVAQDQCIGELKKQNIKLPAHIEEKVCGTSPTTIGERKKLKEWAKNMGRNDDEKAILSFIYDRKEKLLLQIERDLDMSDVEKILIEDRSLLNEVYNNFDNVVANEPAAIDKVVGITVRKLFEDRSQNSFASKFAENQLVGAIGLAGLEKGKSTLKSKLANLDFFQGLFYGRVKPAANKQFYNRWTPGGIKHYLGWDKTPQARREEIIKGLFDSNVLPTVDKSIYPKDVEKKKTEFVAEIVDHVSNYKVHPNPEYKTDEQRTISIRGTKSVLPSKVPKKLTFTEKLAQDITASVTNDVKQGIWDDLNPFN